MLVHPSRPSLTAIVTVMAAIIATTTKVVATEVAGAVTGTVMLSAAASAISTGVSRSQFPLRVSSRSDREVEEFRRLKEIKVRSSQSRPATLS
jgi:hypothetical protein